MKEKQVTNLKMMKKEHRKKKEVTGRLRLGCLRLGCRSFFRRFEHVY